MSRARVANKCLTLFGNELKKGIKTISKVRLLISPLYLLLYLYYTRKSPSLLSAHNAQIIYKTLNLYTTTFHFHLTFISPRKVLFLTWIFLVLVPHRSCFKEALLPSIHLLSLFRLTRQSNKDFFFFFYIYTSLTDNYYKLLGNAPLQTRGTL